MVVRGFAVLVMLGPALAVAKPLPPGLTVTLVDGKVMATRDGVSVPIVAELRQVVSLANVHVTDDGTSLSFMAPLCDDDPDQPQEPTEVTLDEVQAKMENVLGMRAHLKKHYAEAIPHFAAAALHDSTPVYATNLLSAQSMAGKLDDADKTLAAYGTTHTEWFIWRLAADSDLAPLKGRPSTKLVTVKHGTATSRLSGDIAVSPLGLVALEIHDYAANAMPPGVPITSVIAIFDQATGLEVLRIPTVTQCPSDPNDWSHVDRKCQKRADADEIVNRKVADTVLAQLGFTVVPHAYVPVKTDDKGNAVFPITAPDGSKLVSSHDKVMLVTKSATHELPYEFAYGLSDRPEGVAFLPNQLVVVFRNKRDDCGDGEFGDAVTMIPTPL